MNKKLTRKALILSLAAGCALGVAVPAVVAPTESYATQATINKLKNKEAEAEAVRAQLMQLGDQIETCYNDLYTLQEQQKETEAQIAQLNEEILKTQTELERVQKKLANRVSANYKVGNTSLLNVLIGSDNFEDFISRVYYYQSIADSEAKMIQQSKDLKNQLETAQTQLEQRKAEQAELINQNQQRVAELEGYVAESQSILDNLDGEIAQLIEQKVAEEEAAARAAFERQQAEAANRAAQQQQQAQAAEAAAQKAEQEAKADPQNKEKQRAAKRAKEEARAAEKSSKESSKVARKYASGGSNSSIVSIARGYKGISYSQLDCSALVKSVYAEKGVNLPRSSAAQWEAAKSKGWAVSTSDLQPGDLIYYTSPGGSRVNHVAIYSGNGQAIQAYRPGRASGEGDYTLNGTKVIVGVARPPIN